MTLSTVLDGSGRQIVHSHHDGDAVIVVITGEFDLASANSVREALTHAIGQRSPRMIVDLSKVTFLDSSGVHVMLDVYWRCRQAESTLTIRPGPQNVQRVFELTNIFGYLPFEISG